VAAACNLHTAIALVSKMKSMGIKASCSRLVMQPSQALQRRKQQQSQQQVPLKDPVLVHMKCVISCRCKHCETARICCSAIARSLGCPGLQIAFGHWGKTGSDSIAKAAQPAGARRPDLHGWSSLTPDILLQVGEEHSTHEL
jgi:hypothetical protein